MRKLFLFSLLILSIGLHGYICWEEDGKAIRQETQLNYSSAVINLSGGGYMMMWSDASGGRQEMKVQKVSDAGEAEWDSPVILTSGVCYNPDEGILVETSNGDIVAAWNEQIDPTLLRVQRLDTDGNLLWGETGLTFEVAEDLYGHGIPLQAVVDEVGGVYLVWCKYVGPKEIRAIYLDEDGNLGTGWSSDGNILLSANYSPTIDFSVISDNFGGIVTLMELSYDIVFLQRCDNQANLLWGIEGLSIDELYTESEIFLLPWNPGEYAVIVEQNGEFLVNIVNSNGDFSFDEPQLAASIREGYTAGNMQVIKTSDNRLGIIYNEISDYISNTNIQKTEIGIGTEWGEYGIEIGSLESANPPKYDLAADDTGGMAMGWRYYTDWDYNIYYQHCDGTGNLLTGTDPILAGSSPSSDTSFRVFRTADNSVLFWNQQREDRDEIAMQIYNLNEIPQLAEQGYIIWDILAGRAYPLMLKTRGNLSAICWQDGRYSSGQTYIQAINNDTGDLLYDENGIAAINQTELSENYGEICISENCERICITCEVNGGLNYLGVVQLLDQEGNRLLGDDGMIFCDEFSITDNKIASSGDNEFVIVWSAVTDDFINPVYYLKAQKIVNDQFVWGNGVTLQGDSEQDLSHLNIQYPYISWNEWDFPASNLKLTKITGDGSIAPGWDPEGLVVSENLLGGTSRIYMNDTGTYIFWMERNDENGFQLRGQRYSAEGELLWEEGGRLFGDYGCIMDYQLKDDYLYCIVYESGNLYTLYKSNLEGEFVWDDGITIENLDGMTTGNFSIWEEVIIVYGTKSDSIYAMNDDIYAMIYDTDGNVVENLPPGGLELCTEPHFQSIVSCASDENGSSIVLWKDGRGEYTPGSDHSLYVQKIDLNVAPITDEEIIDGNLLNVSNYPNPFRQSTTLKCDLPRNIEDAEIVIYNIKGQKVRSLPATSNEVEWDCRNQAGNIAGSGVYFYVLQGKNIKSETGKMIMLR